MREAASSSEARGVGRIWSRSAAIGLSSRSASGVSPNIAAVPAAMKAKDTHSSIPRAPSTRRASAVRACFGVSDGRGTGVATGKDTGGTCVEAADAQHLLHQVAFRLDLGAALGRRARPVGRQAGRLVEVDRRAATSLRQDGTETVTRSALRASTPKPSRSRMPTASSGGTSAPPSPARRSKRKEALRRQSGSAPASTTSLASPAPPQRSSISRVAASSAGRISAGSMPRSKRARASVRTSWRRPDSATRTGSNSAHSMKASVVSSSQPEGAPPMMPPSASTPAASAITPSSAVSA